MLDSTCDTITDVIQPKTGDSLINFEEKEKDNLEKEVVDMLLRKGLTITCAESCTGGLLSARLVNVSGVSACYMGGFVTYSNEAKMNLLGVKNETLSLYGAVSEQTAREMAIGAADKMNTDVAIGVTGIAGPEGGSDEKPVGLVYIGIKVFDQVYVERFVFDGDRTRVRNSTATQCLMLIKKYLLETSK